MRASISRTALLALLSIHEAARAEAPQLYGRLNLGLEQMQVHGGDGAVNAHQARLSNYRSVFGLRGSEDLGAGLHLLYQIEGTLSLDSGAGALAARDTRLGIEGHWGTLFAGNWTTPYNASSATLDPFYPTTAGYMSIMGNGSAASADNVSDTSSFDRRQRNSVHYWSPAWHGVSLRLARGMSEERAAGGARPALASSALQFERGPLYLALAYERHDNYRAPGWDDYGVKLAGSYAFAWIKLAGAVERLHYDGPGSALERTAYYLALTHQSGPHGLRFGIAKADDGKGGRAGQRIGFITSGSDSGAIHATLGYDYALSRRSSVFAFYTRLRNERRGAIDFAINGVDGGAGATAAGAVLGMRHAF